MQQLILNDNYEIDIQEESSIDNIRIIKDNILELNDIMERLKIKGNLDVIKFKQNNEIISEYKDLILISPMFTINETYDEKILITFGLREKTSIEKRLDALEKNQEIQDEAISGLNSIINENKKI